MANPNERLLAWADESHALHVGRSGVYLFGAVILPIEAVDDARLSAQRLLRASENKAHWRKRAGKRRDEMMSAFAAIPASTVVLARMALLGEREERQRRKCLELLLPILVGCGVRHLTLESRGQKPDKLDIDLLAYMRAQQRISGSALTIDHVPGPADSLLWMADGLCGAALEFQRGEDRWWRMLNSPTIITVDAAE